VGCAPFKERWIRVVAVQKRWLCPHAGQDQELLVKDAHSHARCSTSAGDQSAGVGRSCSSPAAPPSLRACKAPDIMGGVAGSPCSSKYSPKHSSPPLMLPCVSY